MLGIYNIILLASQGLSNTDFHFTNIAVCMDGFRSILG